MIGGGRSPQARFQEILAVVLNEKGSVNEIIERRTKLGLPLYYSCVNNPIETVDFMIVVLTNAKYSPSFSLIMVACTCFCFQYVPKRARERVMKSLIGCLPQHAVPNDISQINSYGSFYENGGAELIPCSKEVLQRIVTHSEEKVRSSVKLISPILATNPTGLAEIMYASLYETELTNASLFLLGQLHVRIKLPKPQNDSFVEKLVEHCRTKLSSRDSFYEMEGALMCWSLLISWGVAEPDPENLKLENNSLRMLAINGFIEKVRTGRSIELPSFEESSEQVINTAYISLICAILHREDFDLTKLQIKHWLLDAILNEFYSEDPPDEIILRSQVPGDMSIESLDLLATIPEYLPMWFYLHILRTRTKNAATAKSCMKIISKAPKIILLNFFDDLCQFLDNVLLIQNIVPAVADMLMSLLPFLDRKVFDLAIHLFKTIDFFSITSLDARLQLVNVILLFTKEKYPFVDIANCIMEHFYDYPTSPSFLCHIFTFFEHVVQWKPEFQGEMMSMALAVITAPFREDPPKCIAAHRRHVWLFKQARLFFSVIATDVVTKPDFKLSECFPPMPAALKMIAKMTCTDSQTIDVMKDALLDAITLCPTEAVLAARILPVSAREALIERIRELLQCCDKTSFNIAASQFLNEEVENLITFDKNDDLRLILRFKAEFTPLILQCPTRLDILYEKNIPKFDLAIFRELALAEYRMDFKMRRLFSFLKIKQTPLTRDDGWTAVEIGYPSAFVRLKRARYIPHLVSLPDPNLEDSVKFTNDFKIRYPVPTSDHWQEDVIRALKLYRKQPDCNAYLIRMWDLQDSDTIFQYGPETLWFVRSIPAGRIPAMDPGYSEKLSAFLVRSNGYWPAIEDDESVVTLEKCRMKGDFAQTLDSDSCSFCDMFLPEPRMLEGDIAELPPSMQIRRARAVAAYLIQRIDNKEAQSRNHQKDRVAKMFSSFAKTNPILSSEMGKVFKELMDSEIDIKKEDIAHAFLSTLLKKANPSQAISYEHSSLIDLAHEIAKTKETNSLLKRFWNDCKASGVDLTKLTSSAYARVNRRSLIQ